MIRAIVLLSLTLAGSSTCLFSQVVYVANTTSGDISAFSVDAGSGALTAIPGSPFPAGGVNATGIGAQGPVGVAVDPMGKVVSVSNGGFGNIVTLNINVSSGVLTGFPVRPPFIDVGAAALVVSPTGKFVYATGSLS